MAHSGNARRFPAIPPAVKADSLASSGGLRIMADPIPTP